MIASVSQYSRGTFLTFCTLILFLVTSSPLHADLEDFKEKFEAEEAQADEKTHSTEGQDDQQEDDESNHWLSDLFTALFRILFEVSAMATFSPYPYAERDDKDQSFVVYPDDCFEEPIMPLGTRDGWYRLTSGTAWLNGLGFMSTLRLDGRLWRFFGPAMEAGGLMDGSHYLGMVRLGFNYALVQTDPFTMDAFFQYQRWADLLPRDSGIVGLLVRSAPLKPLILEGQWSIMVFDGPVIHDIRLGLHLMIDRWFAMAGYRAWSGSVGSWHGAEFGIGVYL